MRRRQLIQIAASAAAVASFGARAQAFPAKPIRLYMEVGDRDNLGRTFRHDWVQANNNMARVLAEKGYKYKYVFARGAGHTDRPTISQLYPTALQWVWQGYPIEGR